MTESKQPWYRCGDGDSKASSERVVAGISPTREASSGQSSSSELEAESGRTHDNVTVVDDDMKRLDPGEVRASVSTLEICASGDHERESCSGRGSSTKDTHQLPVVENRCDGGEGNKYQVGDHVICQHNPVYTHHAVVIGVEAEEPVVTMMEEGASSHLLTILEFTCEASSIGDSLPPILPRPSSDNGHGEDEKHSNVNWPSIINLKKKADCPQQRGGRTDSAGPGGCFRIFKAPSNGWSKVLYLGDPKHPLLKTDTLGGCTGKSSDDPELVMGRVNFSIGHCEFIEIKDQNGRQILTSPPPHFIPSFHIASANCECFAVWCKTGEWTSLQGISFVRKLAGFVGGGALAATPLALAISPWLLALIAVGGVFGGAGTVVLKSMVESEWKGTTSTLSKVFDEHVAGESKAESGNKL